MCDAGHYRSTFECPSGLLYNPVTTTCDAAEKVTCFGRKDKDEETTTVDVEGKEYRVKLEHTRVEKTKPEKEPEQHKGFYFLEDGSDESSESSESEEDDISNQDEIVIIRREFSSNPGHSEEGISVNVTAKPIKDKEEISEKVKVNKNHPLDPSESPLDKDSHEIKEVGESNPNISVDSHDATEQETSDEDYEPKEVEDVEPFAGEDTVDGYKGLKDRLKKREDSVKDAMPKTNETQKGDKTEDDLDKVEDDKSGNISHSKAIKITGPATSLTNDSTYEITQVDDTNVLRFGSLPEPIANWTEALYNGWTDLLIFWKHPVDEDFKGSVYFKYPSDSMSDKLEIKDLVLEILHLADKPVEPDSDETKPKDYLGVDNPQ